jgi:carbonic anhydrase
VQAVSEGSKDPDVDKIAEMNVKMTIKDIKERSPILRELIEMNEIGISGAMYDVATGKVEFL